MNNDTPNPEDRTARSHKLAELEGDRPLDEGVAIQCEEITIEIIRNAEQLLAIASEVFAGLHGPHQHYLSDRLPGRLLIQIYNEWETHEVRIHTTPDATGDAEVIIDLRMEDYVFAIWDKQSSIGTKEIYGMGQFTAQSEAKLQ